LLDGETKTARRASRAVLLRIVSGSSYTAKLTTKATSIRPTAVPTAYGFRRRFVTGPVGSL